MRIKIFTISVFLGLLSACSGDNADTRIKIPELMSCGDKDYPVSFDSGNILSLNNNKTFVMTTYMNGQKVENTGNWDMSDKELTYTPSAMFVNGELFSTNKANPFVIFYSQKSSSKKNDDQFDFYEMKLKWTSKKNGERVNNNYCLVPKNASLFHVLNEKEIGEQQKAQVAQTAKTAQAAQTAQAVVEEKVSPSFSCKAKLNQIEKMICDSQELSLLDKEMSSLYKKTMNNTDFPDALKAEQREWIKSRSKCKEHNCIRNSYIERMEEINNL